MSERLWVAGGSGLAGSAIRRAAEARGWEVLAPSRAELDCANDVAVWAWLRANRPDAAVIAAGRVGGIQRNLAEPLAMLRDNWAIASATLGACHDLDVKRVVYLGSSCQYPLDCPQPMAIEDLEWGMPEPSNLGYAAAKRLGTAMAEKYDNCAAIPCNLYGPGDNWTLGDAHVIPALIVRMVEARRAGHESVRLLGTGRPLREFLHADDLARAVLKLLEIDAAGPWNVGSGEEISISVLASRVAAAVGYEGRIEWAGAPDGSPRKLLDSALIRSHGWSPEIALDRGLREAVADYIQHQEASR